MFIVKRNKMFDKFIESMNLPPDSHIHENRIFNQCSQQMHLCQLCVFHDLKWFII